MKVITHGTWIFVMPCLTSSKQEKISTLPPYLYMYMSFDFRVKSM